MHNEMDNVLKRRTDRERRSAEKTPDRAGGGAVVLLISIAIIATIIYGAVDPLSIGLLGLLVAVVYVIWAARSWTSGVLEFNPSVLLLPLVGMIAIGLIQLLPLGSASAASEILGRPATSALTLDAHATRMFVVRITIVAAFFAACLTFINSEDRIRRCADAIVVFGAAMAFFGILQRLSGADAIYGLRPSAQAIPFGPFVNQHHFAAFMEMTSGLAIGMLLGREAGRERKIFAALAAAVMGIGVVFTGSRGGMISYVVVVAVAGILSYRNSRSTAAMSHPAASRIAAFGGGATILVIVLGAGFFLGGGEALFRGLGPDTTDITSGRGHFWSVAWRIFVDHPLLGAGYDAFAVAFTKYDTWNGMYRLEQAHNDYLQTLSDAGIAGFACIAGFIVLIFRQSLRAISSTRAAAGIAVGALAGCTGILVHSFFDFPLRTTSNALFFLILVTLATAELNGVSPRRSKRRRRSAKNVPVVIEP